MRDKIKPATKINVTHLRRWIGTAAEDKHVLALVATLKSWEPLMRFIAKKRCEISKTRCGQEYCMRCRARKLMEEYDA